MWRAKHEAWAAEMRLRLHPPRRQPKPHRRFVRTGWPPKASANPIVRSVGAVYARAGCARCHGLGLPRGTLCTCSITAIMRAICARYRDTGARAQPPGACIIDWRADIWRLAGPLVRERLAGIAWPRAQWRAHYSPFRLQCAAFCRAVIDLRLWPV